MGQHDDILEQLEKLRNARYNSHAKQPKDIKSKRFVLFVKKLFSSGGNGMNNLSFAKILTISGIILSFVLIFTLVGYETIEGTERAVVQDWNDGVLDILITPGTSFYMPLTTTYYKYKIGTEKFIMGNEELYNGKGADYVDYPPFTITTGGSGKEQPATFSVTLQYHLTPNKLVALHNKAQNSYEDQIIKPALTRIISDLATTQTVLNFYSGVGRVALQKNIELAITNHPSMSEAGIIVETFVIDQIKLDVAYVAEITGRQLATQKTLRAIEEAKAAEQVAERVKAEAKAEKFKKIVQAEAAKEVKIKQAEANKAQALLKADADRYRKEQDARGLLAQGLAQAKVDNARKTSRYSGQSGARQAAVEINQARVELLKNFSVTGIIPEKAALTFINGAKGVVPTIDLNTKGE